MPIVVRSKVCHNLAQLFECRMAQIEQGKEEEDHAHRILIAFVPRAQPPLANIPCDNPWPQARRIPLLGGKRFYYITENG